MFDLISEFQNKYTEILQTKLHSWEFVVKTFINTNPKSVNKKSSTIVSFKHNITELFITNIFFFHGQRANLQFCWVS